MHGHDEAGGAEPALDSAFIDEGLLYVRHFAGRSESFDRHDIHANGSRRKLEAGTREPSIHQHRAGPAFALFAGILGSPQAEPFAQHVQQALAEPGRLDLVFPPVDLELVVLLDQQWTRSQNARAAALWAMTEIAWRRY